MVVTKKVIKKSTVRRNVAARTSDFVPMTKSQLERLYDEEEKMSERAGNAEEKCMVRIAEAIRVHAQEVRLAGQLSKLWDTAEATVNKLIKQAYTKCKNVNGEYKGQKCAEIQIASLKKQIDTYNEATRKADALLK